VSAALADLTWPEAAEYAENAILTVPVGATEQHGPHLPLSTDTDIAVALAEGARRRLDRVVVAPPLAYGSSGEHADFAGTLSIGNTVTELLLIELGRSASTTFSRVVYISTHGGNRAPVARATRQLVAEGRAVSAWSPCWEGDAHAGRIETSIMLALAPAYVVLPRAVPGNCTPLAELMPSLRRNGVRHLSDSGVLGDPTGASATEGQLLLNAAIEDLVTNLNGG
jgi:mycofactocin system creatininase family protein